MSKIKQQIQSELSRQNGILRLFPNFVFRSNRPPGRRMKIHPKDLYCMGLERGGICERWFSSTGKANNGALTVPDEGVSFVAIQDGAEKIPLADAVQSEGERLIGSHLMNKYGGLTSYAKFFDFCTPISQHVHLRQQDAVKVGSSGKSEGYYFPPQLNAITYGFQYSYYGFLQGTTRADFIQALENWGKGDFGDNHILELSPAYRIKIGTGWNIPAGIIHAPGAVVTYEVQTCSDASIFMQSILETKTHDRSVLTRFIPADKHYDFEYLADVLDWDANLNTNFKQDHYLEPLPVKPEEEMNAEGYNEKWVVYRNDQFSAKELTVFPGKEVVIRDGGSYGLIMMDGTGTVNGVAVDTPSIIRYGALTSDELFVSFEAAQAGVRIRNHSLTTSMVMLKNFGPENPDSADLGR